jgi:hypothetical protein
VDRYTFFFGVAPQAQGIHIDEALEQMEQRQDLALIVVERMAETIRQ